MFAKTFLVLFCFLGSSLASSEPTTIHRKSSLQTETFVKELPNQKLGSLTLQRHSIEFCQVRIDFNTFESVGQVNNYGKCEGGWTLTGQIQDKVPKLCGYNSGQHVYADFDERGTSLTMNVTAEDDAAQWDITVTQIACDDIDNRAPVTCLQYYTTVSGNFQSFNYRNIQTNDPPVTYQPANQDYYVCFGSSSSTYTSISYFRGVGTSNFYFTVTNLVSVTPVASIGTNTVSDYGSVCIRDFLVISFGTFTNALGVTTTSNLFCGLGFPATVTTTYKPFQIQVVTDSTEAPFDDGNVGFSLSYQLS